MKTQKINLNTIDKVKLFANIVSRIDADFTIQSERYVIDGKSIMGIFSLDLSKELELVSYNCPDEIWNNLMKVLADNSLLA